MSSAQWYAVYCHAQKELFARDQLLNQDYEVYLPLYKKLTRHARQMREVRAPLFPRYLFVSFDVESAQWRSVNSTRGVIGLVKFNHEKPRAIPNTIIEGLKRSQDEEEMVSLAAIELFKPGQQVRIIDGAFTGQVATYQKMNDKQRVEILLNFLNKNVRMEMPACAIEKAA